MPDAIQLITPSEVRYTRDGTGVEGKTGVLYQIDRTGDLFAWDQRDGIMRPLSTYGTTPAESAGVSYNATPQANVAAMNRALSGSRVVTLTKPGQYLFGGPGQDGILVRSGSAIIAGHGVELIEADLTQSPLLRTINARAPGVTIPAAMTFSSIIGGTGLIATANLTGIGALHPVGSWVAVAGLDPTLPGNRAYQGVFRVWSSTPDAIQFHIVDWPVNGGNSQAGAVIRPADVGIRITGGLWDGNDIGQGAPGYPAGDPREHTMHFRNAQDIIVRGVQFRRGMSWSIGVNNIRDATFEDVSGDVYTDGAGNADVLFQGSGGGRNVIVRGVQGQAKDNLVAWSLDEVGTATYLFHDPGSTYNIKFQNIELQGNGVSGVAIWGNTNHRHHSFVVDGVSGRTMTEGMVKVDNGYTPTAMLNTRGGKLTIKNIEGNCQSALVSIRSDGDWDHIEIDGVRNMRTTSHTGAPLVTFTARSGGTTQTITRVDLRDLHHVVSGATLNRTAPAVTISDTNIGQLKIENMPQCRLAAGTSLIAHTGTLGTINRMVVSDVHAIANAAGDCFLVSCENSNAAAIGQLTVRDSSFTAFDASGGLVRQSAAGKALRTRIDNSTFTNAEASITPGVVRDGTGMTVDLVDVTNTVAN